MPEAYTGYLREKINRLYRYLEELDYGPKTPENQRWALLEMQNLAELIASETNTQLNNLRFPVKR